MSEARVLLHEQNPNGNLEAIVEDDGRTTYLYLSPAGHLGRELRPVWLRNHGPAPLAADREAMAAGSAPRLIAPCCRFPQGGLPALHADSLRVSWTEDGEGLFLLEGDELLAVVPAWTPLAEGGWSRDCSRDSPLASALTPERLADARARLARAEAFWAKWSEPERAFAELRDPQLAVHRQAWGEPAELLASSGSWPPQLVATYRNEAGRIAASVGLSLRPQPRLERDAGPLGPRLRRIELAVAVDSSVPEEEFGHLARFVAEQGRYPWACLSWLGNGHSVECDAIPCAGSAKLDAMLLLAAPQGGPRIALPPVDGEPVNLLWMVPITARERDFARAHGSAKLVERLAAAGVGWMFRPRAEVELA